MKRSLAICAALVVGIAVGGACGDDETNNGGGLKATGEGPCAAADECQEGVCVAIIDGNHPPVYCTQPCGSCPSGFWCDSQTFGLVGLSFCRFGATPTQDPPSEPPRLPCRTDADCDGSLVCATYQGQRDCTITCGTEPDCTPPAVGGFTMDFMTCALDETPGTERLVCLPDPACYENPTSCVTGPM